MRYIWLIMAVFGIAVTLSSCGGGSGIDPLEIGDPERGREIFETGGGVVSGAIGCSRCHSLNGSEFGPPTMQGISKRAGGRVPGLSAAEYIRQSILDPSAYVVEGYPNEMDKFYKNYLSEEDIDNLVAFLLTQ